MMEQFSGVYDSHLACGLAEAYQNGHHSDRDLIQELLLQVSPLIGHVSRIEISPQIPGENRDALCVDALEHLWHLFEDRAVPTRPHFRFTKFIYTSATRAMVDSLRNICGTEVFDLGNLCADPPHGQFTTHRAVEARIQLAQIKSIIFAILKHDCRYTGKEFSACKFMALSILGLSPYNAKAAQYKFRLSKSKAERIFSYTSLQVKSLMYLIKELER